MGRCSFLGRAKAGGHLVNVDVAVATGVYLLHEVLDLLGGHLGSHVGHKLFEFGDGDALVFIAVQMSQLRHHVFWCVLVLEFVFHDELETLVLDLAAVLRVDLLSHQF